MRIGCFVALCAVPATSLRAQAQHHRAGADSAAAHSEHEPLGIGSSRKGSGTAWLPDAAPMRAYDLSAGGWQVMLHGTAFLQYVKQFGTRGEEYVGSTNWVMAAANRPLGGGLFRLRGMFSAEPVTARDYPQLLQAAQHDVSDARPDRQHPHELIGELAAQYGRAFTRSVAAEVYVAAAGEPAIGPVTYLHRPSAAYDPAAPLGHHAQDVTHTTFGVVTVGVFTRAAKLEGSIFNGKHPDDVHTNLELSDARLDSYAGRLTLNPSRSWNVAASAAYIAAENDPAHGGVAHASLRRISASLLHTRPLASRGEWSNALVYGANLPKGADKALHTVLLESSADLDGRNALFGRAEYVRRTAAELTLIGSVSPELSVWAVSLGYAREVGDIGALKASLGARVTANVIPEELQPFYGSRTPLGLFTYFRMRPAVHASGR